MQARLEKQREEHDKRLAEITAELGTAKLAAQEAGEKAEKLQKEKLTSIGGLQKKLATLTGDHDALTQKNNAAEARIKELDADKAKLEAELAAAQKVAGKASQLEADLTAATAQAAELTRHSAQIEQKYKQEVLKRKKLHNELEDMKGKIRVYARVRPLNKNEKDMGSPSVVDIPD